MLAKVLLSVEKYIEQWGSRGQRGCSLTTQRVYWTLQKLSLLWQNNRSHLEREIERKVRIGRAEKKMAKFLLQKFKIESKTKNFDLKSVDGYDVRQNCTVWLTKTLLHYVVSWMLHSLPVDFKDLVHLSSICKADTSSSKHVPRVSLHLCLQVWTVEHSGSSRWYHGRCCRWQNMRIKRHVTATLLSVLYTCIKRNHSPLHMTYLYLQWNKS